jgi:hypothetical protein
MRDEVLIPKMLVPVVDYLPDDRQAHRLLPRRSFLSMAGAGLGFFAANVHKTIFAMFFGDPVTGERSVPILTAMENALLAFHNTNWSDLTVTLCAKDHAEFVHACGDVFGKKDEKCYWYTSGVGDVLVQKAVPGGKTRIDTEWDDLPLSGSPVFEGMKEFGFVEHRPRRAKILLPGGDLVSVKWDPKKSARDQTFRIPVTLKHRSGFTEMRYQPFD